jgi:alpha-amylase
MPDLNYNNPEVTKQMEDVSRFWLQEVGVDGFRLDAAKHLIENKRLQENTAATHEWFKHFRTAYKTINPDAITIGELFGNNISTIDNYTQGDQFDLAFNFELASAYLLSAKIESALPATRAIDSTNRILEPQQYSSFLTNHDQNRVMSELEGNPGKAKVAASFLLMSPGMPFIYYGEEIGMEGIKPDENIRRPMQWSAEENGGFTSGNPWMAPDTKYKFDNVEEQMDDPDSLLSHYRNLIQLRNAHPALQAGEITIGKSGNASIFASLRSEENEAILTLINTSDRAISDFKISLAQSSLTSGRYSLKLLMGSSTTSELEIDPVGGIVNFLPVKEIPAYGTIIFQLEPLK